MAPFEYRQWQSLKNKTALFGNSLNRRLPLISAGAVPSPSRPSSSETALRRPLSDLSASLSAASWPVYDK